MQSAVVALRAQELVHEPAMQVPARAQELVHEPSLQVPARLELRSFAVTRV
jgi:hypothetical protein